MTASDRRARILQLFSGELEDATRSLEEGLLALAEATPGERGRLLEHLQRVAHTLKGSAGMVGSAVVAAVCHELEDRLVALSDEPGSPTSDEVAALLVRVDRIRSAGQRSIEGQPPVRPEAVAGPAGAAGTSQTDVGRTVRIPADTVEALTRGTAQLRARVTELEQLEQRIRSAGGEAAGGDTILMRDLQRTVGPLVRHLSRSVATVEDLGLAFATVPLSEVCSGLNRVVRDVAGAGAKRVRLELQVEDVKVDRRAVGILHETIVHLVRNAVDHGIEAPAERSVAGKPEQGTVRISAERRGDRVEVVVSDDGRGVRTDAVVQAARRLGVPGDTEPLQLVFTPGLSTADDLTEISGRGVGLDAVRDRIESIGGSVLLESRPGTGTDVTLAVPASVGTARVLVVEAGGERLAIVSAGIRRIVRLTGEDLLMEHGDAHAVVDDRPVPMATLTGVLDLPSRPSEVSSYGSTTALLVGRDGDELLLVVDGVLHDQEVLVEPLPEGLRDVPAVLGAATTSSGAIMLVCHPLALRRLARDGHARVAVRRSPPAAPRILLVEDAPTPRALEAGLLTSAGYDVTSAADGAEAWEWLTTAPGVDVVVSDVDMPGMDGIELCEAIRRSPRHREVPVVLVTSLGDEAARQRGAEAGADAYLVKSGFDQREFLATIARLVDRP